MNPPSLRTLFLGSRFTAPLIILTCAFMTYRWWVEGGHGIIGFLLIGLLIASAKAASDVAAYRRWRADWEAMSPNPQPVRRSTRRPLIVRLIGAAVIGGIYLYAWRLDLSPAAREWLALSAVLMGALGMAVVVMGIARTVLPHLRRAPSQALVKVAVNSTLRHIPSVSECYQNLPAYCQQLLRGHS